MLALLDADDTETVILSCTVAPVQLVAGGCVTATNYRCEAAGAAFAARFEAKEGDEEGESEGSSEENLPSSEDYGKSGKEKKVSGPAGYLRISELLKGVHLYDLMGISEGASQEEVKKAYRSLALSAHPDKQASMDPEEAKKVEENFIKIQEAYELLSDPVKRKQYDSSLDFDESLPKLRSGDDFFQVFGETFRRNARFSVKRPVPDLGKMDDEPRVWKRFYDFWDSFQSWRDPVILAQKAGEEICDLAEAECREERRWMQRENERVARKYKQQERERIAKLVNMAESLDPRVQAEKEAKKLAREADLARREEERTAMKRAKEEAERKQAEAEEAARAAEEAKRKEEKAARDAVKERVKKRRQRLRGFYQSVKEHVVLDQLNEVCLQFKEEELKDLGDRIEALKGDTLAVADLFHEAIKSIGMVPMKVSEDSMSTTSGPTDSQEAAEEQRQREEQKRRWAAENEAKRQQELERQAEERAKVAAEKAEEKKKKEELRKKEQAAAEAAKRQQEKKEEQKARKAEERQKKQEEQEKLRREQQREEARLKAQEQSEKDKQLAQQKKQEMELERVIQVFSQDRVNRLTKLDSLSDEMLLLSLKEAVDADPTLAGAFQLLKEKGFDGERAIALVYKVGGVWALALQAAANIRVENALRNRVKKARKRLTDTVANFFKSSDLDAAAYAEATEWQKGIVDGSIEIPLWTQEVMEEEAASESVAGEKAEKEKKKSKSGKKQEEKEKKKVDEDLDEILAELGSPSNKQSSKSKKKR